MQNISSCYSIVTLEEMLEKLTARPKWSIIYYAPTFDRFFVNGFLTNPKIFLDAMSRGIVTPKEMSNDEFKVQFALGTLESIITFDYNVNFKLQASTGYRHIFS